MRRVDEGTAESLGGKCLHEAITSRANTTFHKPRLTQNVGRLTLLTGAEAACNRVEIAWSACREVVEVHRSRHDVRDVLGGKAKTLDLSDCRFGVIAIRAQPAYRFTTRPRQTVTRRGKLPAWGESLPRGLTLRPGYNQQRSKASPTSLAPCFSGGGGEI